MLLRLGPIAFQFSVVLIICFQPIIFYSIRWVPYDIAKPLLDRRKYVVLSDYATLRNGDSLPLDVSDGHMEEQQNEFDHEPSTDVRMHEDEMAELDSDSSDVESDSEASVLEDVDLGNVLMGIREHRLRYKVPHLLFSNHQFLSCG